MRLQDYITEEKKGAIDDAAERLLNDCMPYLKEIEFFKRYNDYILERRTLWRGTNKTVSAIARVKRRKNRKPVDTPVDIHNYIDKEFKKKFGWNVRSSGIFTSSKETVASVYSQSGIYFSFFPIGKYRYVWSPRIFDLVDFLEDNNVIWNDGVGGRKSNFDPKNKEHVEIMKKTVELYRTSGLTEGMMVKNEITFDCDYYYIMPELSTPLVYDRMKEMA